MYRAEGVPTKIELAAYQDILKSWHSREHFDGYIRMLGRRMAAEVFEYDPKTRIETIEAQLDNAIKNKVGKYSQTPALIVYLNMGAYSCPRHKAEAAIACQKANYQAKFSGLHVLWQGQV